MIKKTRKPLKETDAMLMHQDTPTLVALAVKIEAASQQFTKKTGKTWATRQDLRQNSLTPEETLTATLAFGDQLQKTPEARSQVYRGEYPITDAIIDDSYKILRHELRDLQRVVGGTTRMSHFGRLTPVRAKLVSRQPRYGEKTLPPYASNQRKRSTKSPAEERRAPVHVTPQQPVDIDHEDFTPLDIGTEIDMQLMEEFSEYWLSPELQNVVTDGAVADKDIPTVFWEGDLTDSEETDENKDINPEAPNPFLKNFGAEESWPTEVGLSFC